MVISVGQPHPKTWQRSLTNLSQGCACLPGCVRVPKHFFQGRKCRLSVGSQRGKSQQRFSPFLGCPCEPERVDGLFAQEFGQLCLPCRIGGSQFGQQNGESLGADLSNRGFDFSRIRSWCFPVMKRGPLQPSRQRAALRAWFSEEKSEARDEDNPRERDQP